MRRTVFVRLPIRLAAVTTLTAATLALTPAPAAHDDGAARPWGQDGHLIAGRAAAAGLPADMPAFFREADDRLSWLDYEPDRWRSRELTAMDQAFSYDHYVDLENLPEGALDAPHRWDYLRRLYEAGLEVPERDAGFLPWRILELYQRLESGWRRWRAASGEERAWIEERILNDAGVLGHYVADASQPHHTTIHFNGWNSDAPNPRGFTTERDFHGRFEGDFVRAHVPYETVSQAMPEGMPRALMDVRHAVMEHILASHRQVERLYELEQIARFDPEAPAPASHVQFAADRLASGAAMLRDLWWTAWVASARPPAPAAR